MKYRNKDWHVNYCEILCGRIGIGPGITKTWQNSTDYLDSSSLKLLKNSNIFIYLFFYYNTFGREFKLRTSRLNDTNRFKLTLLYNILVVVPQNFIELFKY